MSFNHYAKCAKIYLDNPGCKIVKINRPTKTQRFDGSYNYYDYYYRLVDKQGNKIKYGKFQQLDKLSQYLKLELKVDEELEFDL